MKAVWFYLLFIFLSFSVLGQEQKNIFLKNVKITPEFSLSSQRERSWFCLTGEVLTNISWKASDIEIIVRINYYSSKNYYSIPLHLPGQSRKRFFTYISFKGSYKDIVVSVKKEDRIVEEKYLKPSVNYTNILRIGYFPPQVEHNLYFLKKIRKFTPWASAYRYMKELEEIEISHLQTSLLPERWVGYENMDIMILSQEEDFSKEKIKAIQEWVYNGGILMIAPKEKSWLHRSLFIQKMLGYSISQKSLSYLPVSQKIKPYFPLIPNLLQCIPPSKAILDQDLQNSLWFVYKGAGAILYLGLDVGSESAASDAFWKKYLLPKFCNIFERKNTWHFFSYNDDNEIEYKISSALNLSFDRMPGIWSILIFLSLYLILVGPINFLYLRKKNLTLHLIWTIPCISIFFVLFLLLYGYGVRGINSESLSLHIIQPVDGTDYVCHQKYISLLSASHCVYNIHLEEDGALVPLYSHWRDRENSRIYYRQNQGLKIQDFPLTLWQTGTFSSLYFQENMPFSVEISKNFVQIKKSSTVSLKKIFVLIDQVNLYSLGDFEKDSTTKTFPLNKYSLTKYNFKNYNKNINELSEIIKNSWKIKNSKISQLITQDTKNSSKGNILLALIENTVYSPISLEPTPDISQELKIFYYTDTGIVYENQ